MRQRAIAAITGALLVIATTSVAAQDETQPAAGGLADEAAQLAAFTPPPRLSDRPLGVHTVDCLPAYAPRSMVQGEDFHCGVLTVPQDWNQPDGRNLDLGFVVVHATGDGPVAEPLVVLAGGPGSSAVLTADVDRYDTLRTDREVIFFDIRGAGVSQRLGLAECLALALQGGAPVEHVEALRATGVDPLAEGAARVPFEELDLPVLNEVCWEQFTAVGLDLDQFTTADIARDVVELLKALGHESFNIHSSSYGTRLTMTIMDSLPGYEDAPDLRSVVLDSTFPPSVYLVRTDVRSQHDFMPQLLEECQTDPACVTAYPDLDSRLAALLDGLEEEPLSVDGQTLTLEDVVGELSNVANTRAGYMPRMIAELESGMLDTYMALRDGQVGTAPAEMGTSSAAGPTDPVQQFIAEAAALLDDEAATEFAVLVPLILTQPEPLALLRAQIEESYPGETGEQMLGLLGSLDAQDIAESALVAQMAEAAALEADPDAQALRKRVGLTAGIPLFLYTTIHCVDDILHERYEDALNSYNDLAFPQLASLARSRAMADRCENWPVTPAPIGVKDPVTSDVPAIVLQGAYDVATPVYMGRRADRELEDSTYVLVPQQGHGTWNSAGSCVGRIATAFVQDPDAEVDTSCLEGRRPQWALPGSGE